MSLDRHRAKRAKIEQELLTLEDQIYTLEGKYIRETRCIGNVIDGWDKCLTKFRAKWVEKQLNGGRDSPPHKVASDISAETDAAAIEAPVREEERIFSLSSVTSKPSTKSNNEMIKPPDNPAPGKESPGKETPGKGDLEALGKQDKETPDKEDEKAPVKEDKESLDKQEKKALDKKSIDIQDKEAFHKEDKQVPAKEAEEAPHNSFSTT